MIAGTVAGDARDGPAAEKSAVAASPLRNRATTFV
jgi:hypothetical protein